MGQFSEYDEQTTPASGDILSLKDGSSGVQKRITFGTIKTYVNRIISRQGGSATSWLSPGTSNYTVSTEDIKIECGIFTKSTTAEESITFPTAFTYTPLIIVSVASAGGSNSYVRFKYSSSSNTTIGGIQMFNDSGTAVTGETVTWIAIGV